MSDESVIWPVQPSDDVDDEAYADCVPIDATSTWDSTSYTRSGYSWHPSPLVADQETDTVTVKGKMTITDVDGSNAVDIGKTLKTLNERLLVTVLLPTSSTPRDLTQKCCASMITPTSGVSRMCASA